MADETPGQISPQQLKQAMKAFKKRLKLTRLDEESWNSGDTILNWPAGLPPGIP